VPVYGAVETLSPLIRRVTAHNPGPFTGTGTGSHIIGHGDVAVLDPGPNDAAHVAALLRATQGERIAAILITHTHRDHSPASRALAAASGAPVIGCAPLVHDVPRGTPDRLSEAFDLTYFPDRVLADGESVEGPGWRLEALATPGHASNHLAFALVQERALFTGDHVMGWATSVVAPPDGDMADYLASLARLQARDDLVYHPAHGDPVNEPQRLVRGLILHRRQREAAILALLDKRPSTVPTLVATMYARVDPRLHGAAGLSVLAHLIALERGGAVVREGDAWAPAR